ncbi:MAG: hypothetical protein DMG09_00135 [Acidobacteria bacterium]|nr:MAG: hypothetical protein DMG09_00135 [Acidobacteriota bacterium]
MLFGVRQLAAAFVPMGLLRLREGASKLAHSKSDAPRRLEKCQIAKDFRLSSMEISVNLRVLRVSVVKKQLMYVCCVVLLVAGLVGAADKTNSASATAKAVPADLALLPDSAALQGSRATQQFLVQAKFPDGHEEDLTRGASYTSSDPKVVTVDASGVVRAVADGEAVITASPSATACTTPEASTVTTLGSELV